ncbi:TPA: AraC family transcriptional regulator [Pseudomonas aeruginosa]
MFDTRLIRLPDQSHTHAHEHHQLVMSLAGRAEFEVNGCGGEVCRMRACLVPGEAGHVFAGVGDNRMLIIDLGEDNPTPEDPDLLARLFGEQQPLAASGPLDLERLDAHIVRNLARRITVAELAQVACLSPSHFHAQFKDSVGLTPHQYLLKVRLDCAARLLRESRLPLVRIAEECGFSSQSALTTAMRRYLGLTPKSLRKG